MIYPFSPSNLMKQQLLWLYRQSRGHRIQLMLGVALGLLNILLGLSFIYVSKGLVDIATGQRMGDMWHMVGVLASLLVLRLAVMAWRQWVNGRVNIRMTNDLRHRLFLQVMNSRWQGRESMASGDVMSRLGEDLRVLVKSICTDVPAVIMALFQLLAASWFLFTMQPALLWVLLIIMPVALVLSKVYYRTMRRLTKQLRQEEADIQSQMQESVQNRPLLLSLQRVGLMGEKLLSLQSRLFGTYSERLHFSIRTRIFIQAGFSLGYYTAFVWGAHGIMVGAVTYGMMTAFLQLVAQVQHPILELSSLLPDLVQSMTAVERLQSIDSMPQEEPMDSATDLRHIDLHDVSFHYPQDDRIVISHLSYDFPEGSSTAIVGPTGSGKSTLVRMLLQLLQPTDGTILTSRSSICYVPQGNSLLRGTIRENLQLGKLDASEEEMREALHRASADFVFDLPAALDTRCGEKGSGLSEGQAQRIAIARALLQPGGILIMDEASSALDPDTERQILQDLQHHELGKTLIWVTHHEAVRQYMERCLVVEPNYS